MCYFQVMDLDLRSMARQWRSGSKARAAKVGRLIADADMPSIDEVEAHLKVQSFACTYCGRRLSATKAGKPNMDHRLPIARGGGADVHNLVLSCGGCNRAKGNCTEEEFRSLRALVAGWQDGGKDLFRRLKLGWFTHN
jgi:5-methylcytosine-specific restriction endonuclease McrA